MNCGRFRPAALVPVDSAYLASVTAIVTDGLWFALTDLANDYLNAEGGGLAAKCVQEGRTARSMPIPCE